MFGCRSLAPEARSQESLALKFKKIPMKRSPPEIFTKLYNHFDTAYILESVEGPRKLARYSFIGFDPRLTVCIKNGESIVRCEKTGEERRNTEIDPLQAVRKIVGSESVPYRGLRFVGGAVGYISYDAIRYWERLPNKALDDLGFPDIEMGLFDDGIIFDHENDLTYYFYLKEDRLADIFNIMEEEESSDPLSYTKPEVNITKEEFEGLVNRAKEYVASGDIFQVVLSKRYNFSLKGNLMDFYQQLRRMNPSPYMYFLKMGDRKIIGSSPEMLVRINNRVVETFPIAGTKPCSKDQNRNRSLAKRLLSDPKECAEHVMLVDLARNDLGKVSKFGSIHVPEFMTIHRYSHVQHIVSRVVGKLRDTCDCTDALRGVFPAGTVSGAPKVRAMEIIEEFEPTRRGPYAGAVGYLSKNDNADFAITIRTMAVNKNKAWIQVGAGIVADSIPENEWFETEYKAEALMKALQFARDEV